MRRVLCRVLAAAALWLCLPLAAAAAEPAQSSFEPFWVQNHRATQLWSGQGDGAVSFGEVRPWNYFKVLVPQQGPRLFVLDARTNNVAYVAAADVGPSGPPPPPGEPPADKPPAPALPADSPPSSSQPDQAAAFQPWWVLNHTPTPLWTGPEPQALALGTASQWNYFEVIEPQQGNRLHVREPRTGGEVYIEASAVGPAGAPEALGVPTQWWGFVGVPEVNVRAAPNTQGQPIGQLDKGTPVLVRAWVEGESVANSDPTWAELADGTYIWAPLLRRVAIESPPPPTEVLAAPKWIDVNLALQTVTAYEGDKAVYLAVTSTGRPGWETPAGHFRVQRRVEKEIMDSNTLLGKDAERTSYRVEDVRWTQYFTWEGHAFHENYWKAPDQFGVPSSHGCIGLLAKDAEWLWHWAEVGTPIVIH